MTMLLRFCMNSCISVPHTLKGVCSIGLQALVSCLLICELLLVLQCTVFYHHSNEHSLLFSVKCVCCVLFSAGKFLN